MFQKTSNQPQSLKATQYDLGESRYARVVLEVQQRKSDRVEIEAQAFQIDAEGILVAAPSGAASRTSGTSHTISTSGVAVGTHVLKPGWVRVVGDYNNESIPQDVVRVQVKPTDPGEFDECVYDEIAGIMYRFDMGELERLRQGKCEELLAIINQSSVLAELDI